MRVNLIGEQKKRLNLTIGWAKIGLTIGLIVILFILIGNYYINYRKMSTLKNQISTLDKQLTVLAPKKEEYLQLKEKVNVLESLNKKIQAAQYYWDKVILDYGYIVPKLAKLQSLAIDGKSVSLNGYAANNDQIIELIHRMQSSPFFDVVQIKRLIDQGQVNFDIKAEVKTGGDGGVE